MQKRGGDSMKLKIVTQNVMCWETDGGEHPKRRERMKRLFSRLDPDLIGAQEVTDRWRDYLEEDLPGYGFAQAGKAQREALRKMIERYCLLREQLCSLFVLIDSRLPMQTIDRDFMNWLGENNIPFAIVFTKADKLGKERLAANIDAYKQQLLEFWEELPPLFVTSAESGLGCDELTDYIEQINEQVKG